MIAKVHKPRTEKTTKFWPESRDQILRIVFGHDFFMFTWLVFSLLTISYIHVVNFGTFPPYCTFSLYIILIVLNKASSILMFSLSFFLTQWVSFMNIKMLFTGTQASYQRVHHWKKMTQPPTVAINFPVLEGAVESAEPLCHEWWNDDWSCKGNYRRDELCL